MSGSFEVVFGLSVAFFYTIFLILCILECFPRFRKRSNDLSAVLVSNVSTRFNSQRVGNGEVPVEENQASLEVVSKKYVCCGEERDPKVEYWLSKPRHYSGMPDMFYPGGNVKLRFGYELNLPPGLMEDFIYFIYNYDPMISCFAADKNNPNSTLVRKFLFLTDLCLAYLIFASLAEAGVIYQILVGLLLSSISQMNRLIFTCPCLIGSSNCVLRCIRQCCRVNLYSSFIFMLFFSVGLIAGASAILVIFAGDPVAEIFIFLAAVMFVDIAKRTAFTILSFNSAASIRVFFCGFNIYRKGEWFYEKYQMGCISKDDVELGTWSVCCGCIVGNWMVTKKARERTSSVVAKGKRSMQEMSQKLMNDVSPSETVSV